MKMFLIAISAGFILSSCVPPAPGDLSPSVPGVAPSKKAEDDAFEQGYVFGKRDAEMGRESNYMRFNDYYNSTTKNAFARGYMSGYRKFQP